MKLTKQGIDNLLDNLDMEKLPHSHIELTASDTIELYYIIEYDEMDVIRYCIELSPNQKQFYVDVYCADGYTEPDLWTVDYLIKQLKPYMKKAE